jgi:chemotaxis protein histidine kinase CheA
MVTPSSQYRLLKKFYSDFESCKDLTTENIEKSLHLASSLSNFIRSESLFSKNELLEDVPTESIPFFLVPYYKACILLKQTSQETRKSNLELAESLIDEFLDHLDNYRLTPEAFREKRKSPESKSREEKILAYKAKKDLENSIKFLENSNPEDCRELYVKELELAAIQSLEHLDFIRLEQQMISMKDLPRPAPEPYRPPQVVKIDQTNIHMAPKVISSLQDLTQLRENLNQKVFSNSNPYSMTIEEYGDWVLQETKEREAKMKQAELEKQEFDSDDEGQVEAKRKKDASWDDWKDDHEKGAGNRNGR